MDSKSDHPSTYMLPLNPRPWVKRVSENSIRMAIGKYYLRLMVVSLKSGLIYIHLHITLFLSNNG